MSIIHIDISKQHLSYQNNEHVVMECPIASAARGVGEQQGSYQTPRGWHCIRACIGRGQATNTVFVARRPTGEIYTKKLGERYPDRDWILTRILWLSGLEKGVNRGGLVDTMRRFIYIHGCPDHIALGQPNSHGCIRMRNRDIIRLFDLVTVGTRAYIDAGTSDKAP